MTVLVTGGAGYIGSHTVRQLQARGDEVVVLDSMEFGHREALSDVELVVGSTLDQELLDEVMNRHHVESIIHFAAYKAAGESMSDPSKYFRNNVEGTRSLADSARRAGVSAIVFSSTCAVYGTPQVLPVSEVSALNPESPYGESKLMCEQVLNWFDRCHGLRHVALRYFNAAGASSDGAIGEDWTVTLNLVPIVMKAALERGPLLQVFGTDYPTPDGTAIRDYIHVDDLADAHLRALDYLRNGGASIALNLGTGTGSSVQQVIDVAERVSGVLVPRTYAPRRAGDPTAIWADNTLVRATLGWSPSFGLEDIIESAWQWHSRHPDGFASP